MEQRYVVLKQGKAVGSAPDMIGAKAILNDEILKYCSEKGFDVKTAFKVAKTTDPETLGFQIKVVSV